MRFGVEMKRALFIANIIAATVGGDPMKLVCKNTGHVVAEIRDDHVVFHSRLFERIAVEHGIFIPPLARKQFEGKETVFLGDPLFPKAFVEVFCRFDLPSSLYEWQP